jgi:cytochrome P450
MGTSILFAQTDTRWKKRRAAMSPAFYKGKLESMVELAKGCVQQTLKRWKEISKSGQPIQIEMMEMVSDMHVRILLMCAFGCDFSEQELDFEHDGKVEKKPVSYVLRTTFHECVSRLCDPHVVIFPFLADCYITPGERAIQRNCRRLR